MTPPPTSYIDLQVDASSETACRHADFDNSSVVSICNEVPLFRSQSGLVRCQTQSGVLPITSAAYVCIHCQHTVAKISAKISLLTMKPYSVRYCLFQDMVKSGRQTAEVVEQLSSPVQGPFIHFVPQGHDSANDNCILLAACAATREDKDTEPSSDSLVGKRYDRVENRFLQLLVVGHVYGFDRLLLVFWL